MNLSFCFVEMSGLEPLSDSITFQVSTCLVPFQYLVQYLTVQTFQTIRILQIFTTLFQSSPYIRPDNKENRSQDARLPYLVRNLEPVFIPGINQAASLYSKLSFRLLGFSIRRVIRNTPHACCSVPLRQNQNIPIFI